MKRVIFKKGYPGPTSSLELQVVVLDQGHGGVVAWYNAFTYRVVV